MRPYNTTLKPRARCLRIKMTDSEQRLWSRLRGKQLLGVQFYRQKPLGPYIVDFYAPQVSLVIEIDGAQHFEPEHAAADVQRDAYLKRLDLQVLRFDNQQVLRDIDTVMQVIYRAMSQHLAESTAGGKIPPGPPLQKGGLEQRGKRKRPEKESLT